MMIKLFGIAAFVVMLGAALNAAAAHEVKLLSARNMGCVNVPTCTPSFYATAEVKNLGYEKEVGVYYKSFNAV